MYIERNVNSLAIMPTNNTFENKGKDNQIIFSDLINEIKDSKEGLLDVDENVNNIEDLVKNIIDLINKNCSEDDELTCLVDTKGEQLLINILSNLPDDQLQNIIEVVSETIIESLKNDVNINQNFLKLKTQVLNVENEINFEVVEPKANDVLELIDVKLNELLEANKDNNISLGKEIQQIVLSKQPKEEFVDQIKKLVYEKVNLIKEQPENEKVLKAHNLQENIKNKFNVDSSLKLSNIIDKEESKLVFIKKSTNNSEELITLVENKNGPIETNSVVESKVVAMESQINVIDQIIDKIDVSQIKDGSIIELKLKPDSLGSISIKVEMSIDNVKAEITTSNLQVRNVISKQIEGLTTALSEKGMKVDSIKVSVSSSTNDALNSHYNGNQNTTRHYKNNSQYYSRNTNEQGRQEEPILAEVMAKREGRINVYV